MAVDTAIGSAPSVRPGLPGVIIAATIGNVLEWFDFLVYGFFAETTCCSELCRSRPTAAEDAWARTGWRSAVLIQAPPLLGVNHRVARDKN